MLALREGQVELMLYTQIWILLELRNPIQCVLDIAPLLVIIFIVSTFIV